MLTAILKSYIQKARSILRPVLAQLIFVFIAFAVMVITTYLYVSDNEHRSLRQSAEEAISYTQANIAANLLEPEAVLNTIAETVRGMILQGFGIDMVSAYITDITDFIVSSDRLVADATFVYGVFDVFDGQFCAGIDWAPPEDIVLTERPWYIAAVEAGGKVGITEPYLDVSLGVLAIAYARQIFDNEGNPLGVLSLDVMLDRVRRFAINTQVSNGGYGMLLDKKLNVIAHPSRTYWGRNLHNINNGSSIEAAIRQGKEITEHAWVDYRGDPSVIFVRQLENGWYLCIVIPERAYYLSVRKIAILLGMIGIIMTLMLNVALVRIAAAKSKSDIESRQKTNFLATMSHEIRTPMNAILGITEIQMQKKTLPPDTEEALTKIYNSGYLLLGIINDILDLSKIEAGKLELMPVQYDVADLLHDTTQLNIMRIAGKKIKFVLNVDPFVPTVLFGDELRVKQILNNLLSNAFKFTESGEVVLSVNAKYEDRVKEPHVKLILRVSDTGQGMTAEQVSRLFNEYTRFNLETNRTTEGAGLGMSITYKLVQMMMGNIFVESEPGKGSTFTVYLPQKNTGAVPLGQETVESLRQFRFAGSSKAKTQLVRDPMPYGKVMVVDDVETNLYVAKGLLSPYNLSLDTASSGFEAIDKVKAGNMYDIVFMDHMMPVMDGMEAAKNLRELGYSNPIVALTANAVAGQSEIFLANGFDDFISKPIDIRELNNILNKFIRDKQQPEVIEAARREALEKSAENEASRSSMQKELAGVFVRDAHKTVSILETIKEKQDTLTDEDIQHFIITVHAIKSALFNIGKQKMSAAAQELETAGRKRNLDLITANTPVFLKDLQELIREVAPREEDSGRKTEDDDLVYLQEKLLIFRAACVVYDKKAAKEVIIELKQKKWSRKIKELLNILTEHLLHSDFEEAASIVRDYDFF